MFAFILFFGWLSFLGGFLYFTTKYNQKEGAKRGMTGAEFVQYRNKQQLETFADVIHGRNAKITVNGNGNQVKVDTTNNMQASSKANITGADEGLVAKIAELEAKVKELEKENEPDEY